MSESTTTKPPSRVRKALRWVKRIVLGTLALVVVVVGVTLLLIHTDWGRERIRRHIESALADEFPGGAKVGKLEGSIFGELVLSDVELRAMDGTPMVVVGKLSVDVALKPLLSQTVRVNDLTVERVRVIDPQRPFAPPDDEPDDDDEPSAWTVELPQIALVDARFEITPSPGAERITLDDVQLRANVHMPAGAPMQAHLQYLTGRWNERATNFLVEGKASLGEVTAVESFKANMGALTATGTRLVVDPLRPSGTLELDAPLATMTKLLPGVPWPADAKLRVTAAQVAPGAAPGGGTTLVRVAGIVGANTLNVLARADLEALRGDVVVYANGENLAQVSQERVQGAGTLLAVVQGDRSGFHGMLHTNTAVADVPPTVATIAIDAKLVPTVAAVTASDAASTGIDTLAPKAATKVAKAVAKDAATPQAACEVPVERASTQILVVGEGGMRAGGSIDVATQPDCSLAIVERARFAIAIEDPRKASMQLADVRGSVALDATISGTLVDRDNQPNLAIVAKLDGRRIRQADLYVGSARGTVDATLVGTKLVAKVDASAANVVNAGQPMGRAVVHAETKIDLESPKGPAVIARATAWPAIEGTKRIDVGAKIALPSGEHDPTVIELRDHTVALANGITWKGNGGTIRVGDRITVQRFRTASGTGSLTIDAGVDPATKAMEAKVQATTIPASLIDPSYRGTASGTIALKQRGRRWDGKATLVIRGVATKPDATPLDSDIDVTIAGRRVTVDASAHTARLGTVKLLLDVDGPRDITDGKAWQQLDRKAIRTASVAVDKVNLATVDSPTGGIVDGKLTLISATPIEDKNELRVTGVQTPVGAVDGTLVFSQQANGVLGAAGSAHIEGVGDANLSAAFQFPDRLFDPAAWKQLGRGVAREVVLVLDDVVISPEKLAQLGMKDAPYHGRADVRAGLYPGTSVAKLEVDLRELYGKPLVEPLDLEIRARSDLTGTRAKVTLIDPRIPSNTQSGGLANASKVTAERDLVIVSGETPVTFDRWISEPISVLLASKLDGRIQIPRLEATRLFRYFGNTRGIKGEFGGLIEIAGTLAVPTANGAVYAHDIEGPPGIEGGRAPKLDELKIGVDWNGVAGKVTINGKETDASGVATDRLVAIARGEPGKLESLYASMTFTKFDLAPIAALMPGAFAASTGTLDGNITIHKLDPKTMKGINVWLALSNGRIPLIPILGTLHDTNASIIYNEGGLVAELTGPERTQILKDRPNKRWVAKLGQTGRVYAKVTAPRDLSTIDGRLEMRDVQLIGEVEPIITAIATANVTRQGDRYIGRIDVSNALAVVPEETGEDLADPDAPTDLYIVEDGVKLDRKPVFVLGESAPDNPFLIVDVNLAPTKLEALSILDDFGVRATINGRLKVSLGETLGVDGRVGIERGTVDVLGRIYEIDPRSSLKFDNGTTDGRLEIDMTHNFPSLSLTVMLRDYLSNPSVEFRSEPSIYTQGQLAGFVAGGDPGGDTAQQTREAATGTGAALLSTRLGKRLKRVLPVKLDLIRCDPGSSAAGASCTIGRWLSDSVFVAFKSRLEARPDENSGDLQLQWYFWREWMIEGVGGDRNHNGVDLLWRRRW